MVDVVELTSSKTIYGVLPRYLAAVAQPRNASPCFCVRALPLPEYCRRYQPPNVLTQSVAMLRLIPGTATS